MCKCTRICIYVCRLCNRLYPVISRDFVTNVYAYVSVNVNVNVHVCVNVHVYVYMYVDLVTGCIQ